MKYSFRTNLLEIFKNMKLRKSIMLLLISLTVISALFAEDKEFPVTILEKNVEYYYDGNNLQKYTFQQKYVINNQNGAETWNYTSGSWRPWYQKKPVITATVTNPNGEIIVLDQSTLVEVGKNVNSNIYSDSKRLKAPLPSIKIGSIVEVTYEKEMTRPFFNAGYDTSFTTKSGNPINKVSITINVPVDIDVTFKEFVMELNPEIEIKDNRKVYTIVLEDLEALDSAPLLAGSNYRYKPEIYWTTASNWNSVVKEYQKQISPQQIMDDSVKTFLAGVDVSGSKEEIITNILMHLHKEVRYTGLELGESSIVPHTPDETIARKYGDCKDKAVLLQSLLEEVGIKSNIALLQSGYGPDIPEEIPGIRQFNHAILYLPKPFDLWIDATSEFSRLGELPVTSSNRNALIIDDTTTSLVKTISQKPEDNIRILTHNIYMSQLGEAKVVEKLEVSGVLGRNKRSYFNSLSEKETDEQIGNYVKNSFNSDSFEDFSRLDCRDIRDIFYYELTIPETNYGYTDSDSSITRLNLVDVFDIFPKSLKNFENFEENEGEKEDSDWYERKEDVYLNYPFINQHNYVIHFPEGFVINELPEDEEHIFGSTKYSRTFKKDGNRILIGTQIDSGNANYNPEELNRLRSYIFKIRNENKLEFSATSFKNLYINNDEFQNCINYYISKTESEPNEISHHVRLASAYIEAGFADAGNRQLKIALSLDENNIEAKMAYAFSFLYDELGRNEYKKENTVNAINEYLEITKIDPEIGNSWRNLAVISEYGDEGFRYENGANLENALDYYNQYRENIKKDDLNYNILLDLLKLKQFDKLLDSIDMVKKLNTFDAWGLYFTAMTLKEGVDTVFKYISSLTSSPQSRRRLIETTANNIQQLREYQLASNLMSYIDKSTEKYIEIENTMNFLNSLTHYEDEVINDLKPESVVQHFLTEILSDSDVSSNDIEDLFAKRLIDNVGTESISEELKQAKIDLVNVYRQNNINADVMRDMYLTTITYNVEQAGDIYRIITTVNLPNEQISQLFFAWKEDGKFKLIHNDIPWLAGDYIIKLLDEGNKVDAIKILNWIKAGSDNNDYQSIISRVWKSNKRSDEWIRMGVASLTYLIEDSSNFLIELEQIFLKNGLNDIYTWMLATHYQENGKHKEAYELIKNHIKNEGLSTDFGRAYFSIFEKNGKHNELHEILMESIKFEPTNLVLINEVAFNFQIQGKHEKAFDYLKSYTESYSDSANIYNNLAWSGLFTDHDSEELLSYAITANQITKFENNSYLDTLAVILAEIGKVKQSREILLHLIGDRPCEDLDGEFYIMGLNAETLGLYEEAIYYYSQVKEPERESGTSTYLLARRKLEMLL